MFLKNLLIENHGTIIRNIAFHKGINLIVDETSTRNKQESGNNVGKTTVLRLIDFCLGGKGENIYTDPEFKDKGANTAIEKFLKDNNVLVTLVLKEDLEVESSREITIKRNFLPRKQKIQEINGETFSNEEFPKKLSRLIFKIKQDKPTFRQLISKNIRDEKNRLQHTLKVLHPTTKQEEYEALFFFWLGIEVDSSERKQKLLTQLKLEEGLCQKLGKERNLAQINQALIVLQRNIDALERKQNRFAINENFEEDLKQLNAVKKEINNLAARNSQIELRKELIMESKAELEKEISYVDVEQIELLYKEAKALIPNLQKTFEDTLAFHNKMLSKKKSFIEQELPEIEQRLKTNKRALTGFLDTEKDLSQKLKKAGAIESLQEITTNLNIAYEQKGRYDEQKNQWENSLKRIDDYQNELREINEGIHSLADLMEERIVKFNEYFSDISSRLYGEQFILSPDRNNKGYELNISTISGNPGTGKKKGEIVAFDLAYIKFADALNIKCLHFVLHDQIEAVHDNQISNLLTEIIKKVNCQYVLPVLRDKLPSDIDVSCFEILSLSQSSKLFKV